MRSRTIVADLDGDGVNEVAVGTEGYSLLMWGSFYAFDWTGDTLKRRVGFFWRKCGV